MPITQALPAHYRNMPITRVLLYYSLVSDGARAQSRGQPVIFPRADQGENPGGDPAAEVWLRPVERGQ